MRCLTDSSATERSRRASASVDFISCIWRLSSHNSSVTTSEAIRIRRSSPTWPNFTPHRIDMRAEIFCERDEMSLLAFAAFESIGAAVQCDADLTHANPRLSTLYPDTAGIMSLSVTITASSRPDTSSLAAFSRRTRFLSASRSSRSRSRSSVRLAQLLSQTSDELSPSLSARICAGSLRARRARHRAAP